MKRIVLAAAIGSGDGVAGVPGVRQRQRGRSILTLSARDYHYWRHRHHHRGWWNHYAGCRVVVRSHINRWGERVFVRRRVCY